MIHRFGAPVVVALLLTLSPGIVAAQANDAQIQQAKQMLTEERFIEALAAAKDASRADISDYRAHYYIAMAYMGLRQYDQAEVEAGIAEGQAPEAAKVAVRKLSDTIRSLRDGNSALAEADAALAEGLVGKAARLYEAAWSSGRNAPDFAFKAAALYANRLSQPVDAARVLRQVKQAMPASAASDKADTGLEALAAKLRTIAKENVDEARVLPLAQALPKLKAAEDADPTYPPIYVVRAQLAGREGSTEIVQQAVKDMARRNLINIDTLSAIPNMRTMLAAPAFSQFMTDVIGSEQAGDLAERVSPAGQVALLSRLAQQGQMQLFVGRKSDGAGRFSIYSRRKVTAVQGFNGCQSSLMLGEAIAVSANLTADLPSRVVDWRLVAPAEAKGDFISFGPMFDGWESTGINVTDTGALPRAVEAIRTLREVCPAPPPTKRRMF